MTRPQQYVPACDHRHETLARSRPCAGIAPGKRARTGGTRAASTSPSARCATSFETRSGCCAPCRTCRNTSARVSGRCASPATPKFASWDSRSASTCMTRKPPSGSASVAGARGFSFRPGHPSHARPVATPLRSPRPQLGKEESNHLGRSIGARGVGERPTSTAARPRMSRPVHDPMLDNGVVGGVQVVRAAVPSAARGRSRLVASAHRFRYCSARAWPRMPKARRVRSGYLH